MNTKGSRSTQHFRRLVRRLNEDGNNFDLSAFIQSNGIDQKVADAIAESVYARFYAQVLEDCQVSEREGRQLQNLARRLAISEFRRTDIEREVASETYRARMRDAQADGVLTKDELEELRQLKSSLRLSPSTETTGVDRRAKFARVKASHEYAERNSPARHARLPKYPAAGKIVLWVVVFGVSGFGVLTCLMGGLALFAGVAFVGVPFVIFGTIAIAVGCLCCWVWVKRLHQVEKTPVVAGAAIVVSKRKDVKRETWSSEGREGRISDDRSGIRVSVVWYATFEDEQGDRQEYELFALDNSVSYNLGTDQLERAPEPRFAFYSELAVGDAGVLYARDNVAFDFDKIC